MDPGCEDCKSMTRKRFRVQATHIARLAIPGAAAASAKEGE